MVTGLVVVVGVLLNVGIIKPGGPPPDVNFTHVGAQEPYNKSVAVVFVHGIFGTKNDTWLNRGNSFPALLAADSHRLACTPHAQLTRGGRSGRVAYFRHAWQTTVAG